MSEYANMSDDELLRDKLSEKGTGDSGKIAELISRYMKKVFDCARKYSSCADYEELVSAGMEGLLSAVQSYDSTKGSFSGFASVCIKNQLLNTVKKSLRRNSIIAGEDELTEIPDEKPTPEEALIQKESSEAVLRAMETELTPLELQCIECVAMGLSYSEIAERLKVDTKTVDNGLTRARTKLRRKLSEED